MPSSYISAAAGCWVSTELRINEMGPVQLASTVCPSALSTYKITPAPVHCKCSVMLDKSILQVLQGRVGSSDNTQHLPVMLVSITYCDICDILQSRASAHKVKRAEMSASTRTCSYICMKKQSSLCREAALLFLFVSGVLQIKITASAAEAHTLSNVCCRLRKAALSTERRGQTGVQQTGSPRGCAGHTATSIQVLPRPDCLCSFVAGHDMSFESGRQSGCCIKLSPGLAMHSAHNFRYLLSVPSACRCDFIVQSLLFLMCFQPQLHEVHHRGDHLTHHSVS